MNLTGLLKRVAPVHEPLLEGTWSVILFKPDLASRQEFIIGVAATLKNGGELYIKWLPSFTRLSKLYGDILPTTEITGLINGCTNSMKRSLVRSLEMVDVGSPHLRIDVCGYFSTDDIDLELNSLLKRHSGAIWGEPGSREDSLDDDWAYSEMLKAMDQLKVSQSFIIQNRILVIGHRKLTVAFDNGKSYGSVVSARYANYSTVERHIYKAHVDITSAHKLSNRGENPALFVILPPVDRPEDIQIRQKSLTLLEAIEDTGVQPYASDSPLQLAEKVEKWAQY